MTSNQKTVVTIFVGVFIAWLFATLVFATGNLGAQEVDSMPVGKKFMTLKSALAVTSVTNNPLVVVMSGDRCPWCVKQIQEIEKSNNLKFDWVVIKAKDAPKGWRRGNSIPQLRVIQTKLDERMGKTTVGYKSVANINAMIK